jgi:hypothetical protein
MTQSAAAAESIADSPRLSRENVVAIWQKIEAAVSSWEESKTPVLVEWEGGLSRSFEMLEPAVVDLMESLQDDTVIDKSAWAVVLAIDVFIASTVEWAESVKINPRGSNPSGSKAVWDAFREVRPAMEDRLPERLESVASLLSLRNMTPQHVAVIYDWYDESGNPDVDRVEEERMAPGKHSSGQRNPAKVKKEKQIEERWRQRCEQFGGYDPSVFDGDDSTERPENDQPPAPESFEELLSYEGMTLDQVARMKQVSIEEVREHAREIAVMNADVAKMMGAELASEKLTIDPAKLARRVQIQAATMETYPELETNERVWSMSDDGWGVGRIAAGLRAHGVGVSYEDVLRYLSQKPEVVVEPRKQEAEAEAEGGQAEAPPQLKAGQTRGRPPRKAAAST